MPAYIGGETQKAGIKWIASFPNNPTIGLSRAQSVTILNDFNTGEPIAILQTSEISSIRTASVSLYIIKKFLEIKKGKKVNVGVVGMGPIGQAHLEGIFQLFNDRVSKYSFFDLNPNVSLERLSSGLIHTVEKKSSWQDVYLESDIFITCTVSDERYIDLAPKDGSLHLNVSLRDYKVDTYPYFKETIYVDSWEEVCRENTDIESYHNEFGLKKEQVKNLIDIKNGQFKIHSEKSPIMFNPMGMAVFDIAIADLYASKAKEEGVGFNT